MARLPSGTTIPMPMVYRIEATITASDVLAAEAGLRRRVEEVLTGILQTAEEIRRLGDVDLSGIASLPMQVRVANHLVWYALDLDRLSAKVLVVDRMGERAEGKSRVV